MSLSDGVSEWLSGWVGVVMQSAHACRAACGPCVAVGKLLPCLCFCSTSRSCGKRCRQDPQETRVGVQINADKESVETSQLDI